MKKYNIIIIGAGCSGLSLAYRLLDTNMDVCILESGSKNNRVRKTWSYWDVYDHPFTCLLYTSPSPRDGLLCRMPSSA